MSDSGFTRNPVWTEEETSLALDLYLSARPRSLDESDAGVIELSGLLRAYATRRGVGGAPNFRNPAGVAMKVANLSRLDPAVEARGGGLQHGSGVEEIVWQSYNSDPVGFADIVRRLKRSILLDRADPTASYRIPVSRGPRPSFGEVTYAYEDGESLVYVMILVGGEHLFPDRDLAGRGIVKVGRTNNIVRRSKELNAGFPPGSAARWEVLSSRAFPSASEAHDFEQRLLTLLDTRQLAIGGEFAEVSEVELFWIKALKID